MNSANERRAPGATRIPFDGMVEVGGSLGPAFEAQAVNLSEEGMQIRTAYVPEVGQPITCRFDAGQGLTVVAAGEVLWKEEIGDGGEFGIRFNHLDAHSTVSLQRIIGMAEEGVLPRPPQGRKIRLHIEGLASPMRARLRASDAGRATAYSELGFLEMGKTLELEDALSGARRPALIDRVDVAVDEGSRIPQLVVTLRYDDEEAAAETAAAAAPDGSLCGITIDDQTPRDALPHAATAAQDEDDEDDEEEAPAALAPADIAAAKAIASDAESSDDLDEESRNLKGALARTAAKITPAVTQWAKRAKTTMTLLAAKAAARHGGSGDDVEIPVRRTTAPAPGGGLHTAGRKVVRGEVGEDRAALAPAKTGITITKKRAAIGGAVGLATVLAIFALRTPDAPAPLASAPPPVETAAAAPETDAPDEPYAPPEDPLAAAAATGNSRSGSLPSTRLRSGRPTPFTNGSVGSSGNVIRIKMDGEIESILGASQPTGFTVVIPNRHSMDAAGPLARKDPRIAALRMANEEDGAELTVTFKDGVPPYAVRARGDVLEMVLAKASANGPRAAAAKAPPPSKATKKKRRR